ncbi:tail protein [Flavobacterium sp. 316]|uniref:Tail fiber protein n=1 Tax=Flavobacterium sediminilitoris TaxID=2024526 RepID=A0ABY4HL68_9FLAO|nr:MULTISPECIES: tail fiber protein [Flavobacterium]KIX22243.1 tail protein [Flavobacterium sp. 316]UOX32569.1 tail fiber protein [Flavobacterium sediminilitoris]
MSTEPFIGEIKIFGFYFPPRGYMTCQGQILSIAQNTALFSLIGTTYGGNGQTTFALPDLQGRMPIGQGQGPGLPNYNIGQKSGNTTVTLLSTNLPAHIHTLNNVHVLLKASSGNADEISPDGNFPATTNNPIYSGNGASPGVFTGGTQVTGSTDPTGSNIPLSIMNPYLTINYSIATVGIFPSRN